MSSLERVVPGATLPRWFMVGLTAALVFVASAGLSGVALLVLHLYEPWAVCGVAALAALAGAVGVSRLPSAEATPAHGCAVAAVAIALAFLAVAGLLHSEHLLVDRDPAVYINTGRSIAAQHTLAPGPRVGPFEDSRFIVASPGYPEVSGKLQSWFLPMLPVLLALGWSIGGLGGLFFVTPVVGALGLLACYALASRLVGARWALFVPLLLAVNPLQSWFARDAYSELVVQVVALGGIWLYLVGRAALSPRIAGLAGGVVATSALARFDALAIVAALVAFAAVEWTRSDDADDPRGRRRVVVAFGLVLLVLALYCTLVTYSTSRDYLDQHAGSTRPLRLLLVAAVVGAIVWVGAHHLRPGFGRRLARARATFVIVAAGVLAVAVWAYVWRPASPTAAFSLSVGSKLPPNSTAWLNAQASWSLRWFVDWFGIAAIVLAVLGLLVLVRRALRGDVAASAGIMVVAPLAVLYLARPSVSPDQPWAMRRFFPVVIPGVVMGATVSLHGLARLAGRTQARRRRSTVFIAVFSLTAAVVTQSAVAAVPLAEARVDHGAIAAVQRLCGDLPSNAAVLVFPVSYLDNLMPQTIRAFCEVPTARDPLEPKLDLAALAGQWNTAGRQLFVVTALPSTLQKRAGAQLVAHFEIDDRYDPQYTYRVRSRRYEPQPHQFWLFRIAASASATNP